MNTWCVLIENDAVWCPDTESQARHLAWNIYDVTGFVTRVERTHYASNGIMQMKTDSQRNSR